MSTFAGGLQKLGVKKGDRVVIYMPAVLETTVAMLACARLGAVHSVVFGGFASLELAARIEDAQPKVHRAYFLLGTFCLPPANGSLVTRRSSSRPAVALNPRVSSTTARCLTERSRSRLGSQRR